jgi:hypothetical protein
MNANQAFPIAAMARVLGVSKAGYYAWRQRPASAHATADATLLKRIKTVHASSRQTYGAPRVHADLRRQGEKHSRKRIAHLMREAGLISASHRHGGPTTTRRNKDDRPAPDLVDRDFSAAGPNQLWVADITPAFAGAGSRFRQWRGFSTSLSYSMPGAARSSVGRWQTTCAPNWYWMRWRWRWASGGPKTSSTTVTKTANLGSSGRCNACLSRS